jgi:hypothetical protein
MKRIFYSFVVMLLCVQTMTGQDIIQIDPERISRGTLTLSDMIESIEYIPLETNSNCFIGDIHASEDVLISDNYIFVCCKTTQSCYLFNRAGKFIAKIGNKGNGPGEYLLPNLFAIDEKSRQVILSDPRGPADMGKLLYYDLNGKYVKSVSVDSRLTGFFHTQFDDKHVVMQNNNPFRAGDPPFNYYIFSNNNELITQKIKNIDYTTIRQGTFIMQSFCYYLRQGQLHVKKEALNDTIYSISKGLSFSPKYIINAGKYSLTAQLLSNPDLFGREKNNRVLFSSAFETDNYVLISFIYKEKNYYQYYDKNRRQSSLFNSVSGIPNDYDGGWEFWPRKQKENELITWYNAYLFEEKNDNKLKPKGPQKAVEHQKKTINEIIKYQTQYKTEANPIIVIAKLKQ